MKESHLFERARQVREKAYAPYSDYKVGAALLDELGETHVGVNFENASYGATICAERGAIAAMVASGAREIREIAVVTENGGNPCGICLQVMSEFMKPEALVHLLDASGRVRSIPLRVLAPSPFDFDEPRAE